MAIGMKQFRFGALFKFDPGNSVTQMNLVSRSFKNLSTGFGVAQKGMLKMSAGFAAMRFLPTGFSNAMRGAIGTAMDFEQQMKAVQAVSGASGEAYTQLSEEAKRLGIVSAFSAQEAAAGMEFLARAGFKTEQIMSAIGPVLNAAAADGIDLATSADIVANTIKGMGLAAEDAGRVANVLALTSARANTNITGLGEGMTYATAQARTMGFSVEETAAALGLAADAGLKGSVAGTSFTNMLVKLTKPSEMASGFMKQFGIHLTDIDGSVTGTKGKMLGLAQIMEQFIEPLKKIPDDAERAAMMTELFGIRGQKAFNALQAAGIPRLRELVGELEGASDGIGAAGRMAAIRLDNLAGALTLFKSSMQGLAIETVAGIGLPLKEGVQAITNFVNTAIFAIKGASEKEFTDLFEGMADTPKVLLGTARTVGAGIRDFFAWFQGAFQNVKTMVSPVFTWIENLSVGTKRLFGAIGIGLPVISGLLTPLLAGLGLIIPAVTAGIGIISGAIGVVIGGLIAIKIPMLALAAVFVTMKKDGESWGQTFMRFIVTAKDAVVSFATAFWSTFKPFAGFLVDELGGAWQEIVQTVRPSLERIGVAFGSASGGAEGLGSKIGWLAGVVTMAITSAVRLGVTLFKIVTAPVRAILWLGEAIGVGMAMATEFVINTYDKLASMTRRAGAFFIGIWQNVSNWVGAKIEGARSIIQQLAQIWKPYFQPVFDWLSGKINTVTGWLSTGFNMVTAAAATVINTVTGLWQTGVDFIFDMVTSAATAVTDFVAARWQWLSDNVTSIAQSIWSGVLGIIDRAATVVSGVWSSMKTAIAGLVEFIRPIANKVINFLLQPYRAIAGAIAQVLTFEPVKKSLAVLGWDISGVADAMQSFASKGVALAKGGMLLADQPVQAHANELVLPLEKFRTQILPDVVAQMAAPKPVQPQLAQVLPFKRPEAPRVAAETTPERIETIREQTVIKESAKTFMPEIRPQVTVNVPESQQDLRVENVITLDGAAIARALGQVQIQKTYREGKTFTPEQTRQLRRTGSAR